MDKLTLAEFIHLKQNEVKNYLRLDFFIPLLRFIVLWSDVFYGSCNYFSFYNYYCFDCQRLPMKCFIFLHLQQCLLIYLFSYIGTFIKNSYTHNTSCSSYHLPYKAALTCCSVLTEAPSFAEPADGIMEKIANSKVIIPCPAKGTKWFIDDSA